MANAHCDRGFSAIGHVGRPLQVRGEPLAAADVASLRMRVEVARAHVLDHAVAQRPDGIGTHGNTPWNDLQYLYFIGYAFWNYFTTPFLLASEGVICEEVEPWEENHQKCAALLCLITSAQNLRELPGVAAFIQQHPGIAQSAPSVDSGFPWWLQLQHFLNMFFMLFIMRAGLQILADHPRLYWGRDAPGCIAGAAAGILDCNDVVD
jgi:hypothetical protein